MRMRRARRTQQVALVAASPLRNVDPRAKLFISLAASFVVMLPLQRLIIFIAIYGLFLLWARLLPPAAQQVWRLKWLLLALFALDWWLIDLQHALVICTRLILLSGIFALFFSTTTTRELSLALERLKVPYRYAFSLSLAFQSLTLLDNEWRAIREAQVSRGAIQKPGSLRELLSQLGDLIALTVPAIVLTTKRAWSITEAAYARGFDSPGRQTYHTLAFIWSDYLLMSVTLVIIMILFMA